MPNWSKIFQTYWLHSLVFALEKQPSNLNFHSLFYSFLVAHFRFCFFLRFWVSFTSKKPFGGYFRWNACTNFQKIYSWTRYTKAKLIKNISKLLVALFRLCFRKTTWKAKLSEFFLPLKSPFGGYFQWNTCSYFQK